MVGSSWTQVQRRPSADVPTMRRVESAEHSVEQIRAEIARIVGERQELRTAGAGPEALELNRRRLVEAQARLSEILIRTHLGPAAA